jgi:hypothetical protein
MAARNLIKPLSVFLETAISPHLKSLHTYIHIRRNRNSERAPISISSKVFLSLVYVRDKFFEYKFCTMITTLASLRCQESCDCRESNLPYV